MLKYITGSEDLDSIKLSDKTKAYLLSGGLSREKLDTLIKKLSGEKAKAIVKPKSYYKKAPQTGDPVLEPAAVFATFAFCALLVLKKREKSMK